MRRKTSPWPSRIYTYGCPLGPIPEHAKLVEDQFFEAHRYRNALCEIAREFREKKSALLSTDLALATAEAEIRYLKLEKEALYTQLKTARSKAGFAKARKHDNEAALRLERDRQIAALKEPLELIQAKLEIAYARLKECNARAREVKAAEIEILKERAKARIKVAREEASKKVFWGTRGLVEKAAESMYKGVEPPDFIPWSRGKDRGRIGVQVQKNGVVKNLPTHTFFQLDPVREDAWATRSNRRKLTKTRCRVRVDSTESGKPVWAEFAVILHRPLPDDAIVKSAWVLRRRIGFNYKYELQISLEAPSFLTTGPKGTGTVGIDLGWRKRPMQVRRIGYFCDDQDQHGELMVPPNLIYFHEKPDELRSIQDKNFDAIKAWLGTWLKNAPVPENWLATKRGEETRQGREHFESLWNWKSCKRLAELVWRWRNEGRFDGDQGGFEAADAWRVQWRHLYRWEMDLRRKAIASRNEIYKLIGAKFGAKYAIVKIEDFNLSKVARRKTPDKKAEELPKGARNNRQRMSPSAFRSAVVNAAQARGAAVVYVEAAGTTIECNACKHVNADWDKAGLMLTCAGCGKLWDQDENAARNILASTKIVIKTPKTLAKEKAKGKADLADGEESENEDVEDLEASLAE